MVATLLCPIVKHHIETTTQSYHKLIVFPISMPPAHLTARHIIYPISTTNCERNMFSRTFNKRQVASSITYFG